MSWSFAKSILYHDPVLWFIGAIYFTDTVAKTVILLLVIMLQDPSHRQWEISGGSCGSTK